MKIKLLFLISIILFLACNSKILIKDKDLSYTRMIENISDKKVIVELKNEQIVKGKITKFSLDSIYINPQTISMNNISKIIHKSKSKDFEKLLLLGALAGSAAALAAEIADDSNVVNGFLIGLFPFAVISDFTNKKDVYVLDFEDQSN